MWLSDRAEDTSKLIRIASSQKSIQYSNNVQLGISFRESISNKLMDYLC